MSFSICAASKSGGSEWELVSKISDEREELASRTAREARPRGENASPQKEAQRESNQGGQHEGTAQ